MHKADVEAIGALVGDGLAAGGGLIREMHEGIASRPFEILGPSAAPARVLHDGISRAVYGTVRGGLRAASRGAATLVALRITETEAPLDATPAGSVALGGVNGLYGNHISERGNRLAFEMQLRREGATVSPTREGLASAFPDATSRVAVFVHGLCENDESWRHFPLRGDRTGRRTYGERLQDELSFTPVHLRYNTGLRVSHNGRRLAQSARAGRRGVAGGGRGARARRPLDGRARRPQCLPLRRGGVAALRRCRAPRVLPRVTAPWRRSGKGRQRARVGARSPALRRARWVRF